MPEKQRGTALILQLARNPDNLEEIFGNGEFGIVESTGPSFNYLGTGYGFVIMSSL